MGDGRLTLRQTVKHTVDTSINVIVAVVSKHFKQKYSQ